MDNQEIEKGLEKQRKKSLIEARAHDRTMLERDRGSQPVMSKAEEEKILRERDKNQKLAQESAENSNLEIFTGFINDPLAYLHSVVSQGEFANRDQRSQLYTLLTMIKIENDLRELINVLKARK